MKQYKLTIVLCKVIKKVTAIECQTDGDFDNTLDLVAARLE